MKKKLLVAALVASASTATFAQSAFEGFYGQVATGYLNTSVASQGFNAKTDAENFSVSSPSTNKGSMPLMLGLGYNFSVSPKFLLGLGAEYQAISSTTSTATFSATGCSPCYGVQYKASNQYSIFVTTGYEIDKDKLTYLKAGYSSQSLQATYQAAGPGDTTPSGTSFGTSTVTGYILGLGYKQMISSGFYGFAEANYYAYGKASFNNSLTNGPGNPISTISGYNPSSSAYNLLVGVGYKF